MEPLRKAFVLRVWHEQSGPSQQPEIHVRGSLQSVRSEDVAYFTSYEQLIALLQAEMEQLQTSPARDQAKEA